MGPILNGYGFKDIFNSRTRPHVNRAFITAGVWWLTLCIAYCIYFFGQMRSQHRHTQQYLVS